MAVDKDPRVETSCSWLINSCALLISEFCYYINATMSLYSVIWVLYLCTHTHTHTHQLRAGWNWRVSGIRNRGGGRCCIWLDYNKTRLDRTWNAYAYVCVSTCLCVALQHCGQGAYNYASAWVNVHLPFHCMCSLCHNLITYINLL